MRFYRVYGLSIAATDGIDGLVAMPEPERIDCTVMMGEWPADVGTGGDVVHTDAGVVVSRSHDGTTFAYADGTRFFVTRDRIWCTWTTTPEDAATYLVGPILGYVLRLRGVLSLHASAVMAGERAIVIAAAHGEGKSTTAAAFARRGHAILSDDVVPLVPGEEVIAQPGYPRIRLWDKVAMAWFGELPVMTPNWPKRYLDVSAQFRTSPARVAALYVLGDFSDDETEIVPLHGADAALRIVRHTSMNLALDGRMRAEELELVAKVVERVRIAEVRPPRGLDRIDELCNALVRDSSGYS